LAGVINSHMPGFTVRGIADALNERRKCLKGSKILGVGVAYKRDTNDVRESPAVSVLEELREKGATVYFSDPYVPAITINGHLLKSLDITAELVQSMDCVAILTDHSVFDYALIAEAASLVYDTRNALRGFPRPNVLRL